MLFVSSDVSSEVPHLLVHWELGYSVQPTINHWGQKWLSHLQPKMLFWQLQKLGLINCYPSSLRNLTCALVDYRFSSQTSFFIDYIMMFVMWASGNNVVCVNSLCWGDTLVSIHPCKYGMQLEPTGHCQLCKPVLPRVQDPTISLLTKPIFLSNNYSSVVGKSRNPTLSSTCLGESCWLKYILKILFRNYCFFNI